MSDESVPDEPNPSLLKETSIGECNPRDAFWIHNGPVVSSLRELAQTIRLISDEMFRYHVNSEKNDFASWIYHTFGNPYLARDLDSEENRSNKDRYAKTINDHLDWLEHS